MKDYNERIARLRLRKLAQTQEKIRVEGALDEDDYGRIVPPPGVWHILPNNPDGSFYGYDAWADNFCDLMSVHPVYIDPDDAFAGRWMYFMSKMRPNKWNPDYPYDHLKENIFRSSAASATTHTSPPIMKWEYGLDGAGWSNASNIGKRSTRSRSNNISMHCTCG